MIGLYVHVPFCVKNCRYCDFPSYSGVESYIDAYVDAVCREISLFPRGEQAETDYFGGGTPSLLRAGQIGSIMKCLAARFDIAADAEITVEANPDSVSRQYVCELAELGVNRVSLGIQSFDDGMLRFLGRGHTADEGKRAVQAVWDGGVRNISIDKFRKLKAQKRPANLVMALDELADVLPDERYAPGRNDEEIGKSISIFLYKQKEEIRRVFLLKYFYFESNIAIAERCGFTERKVTHMLAHTRAQLKEYLIKEEIYL